jgi:hypothetical protein
VRRRLDPEISDSTLDFRVAEQELDGTKVAGASVKRVSKIASAPAVAVVDSAGKLSPA